MYNVTAAQLREGAEIMWDLLPGMNVFASAQRGLPHAAEKMADATHPGRLSQLRRFLATLAMGLLLQHPYPYLSQTLIPSSSLCPSFTTALTLIAYVAIYHNGLLIDLISS